ncbi:hypothetical protein ACSSS7_004685 [Eimeria intestinalis]
MAGGAQLRLFGEPAQSYTLFAEVEKGPDNSRHTSTEDMPVARQTRHRVFHQGIVRAATAYAAILACAFLILLCVRPLSALRAEGGRVRSLAGAEGDEPVVACEGSGEAFKEGEDHDDEKAQQQAIIEQARENIEEYKDAIMRLTDLAGGHAYHTAYAALSLYILLLSDLGALGAFIDRELLPLRSPWLEAMQQAVNSAGTLHTGWNYANSRGFISHMHSMIGDMVEMIGTIRSAKKRNIKPLQETTWALLQRLVQVQPVAIAIARKYLVILHPQSKVTRAVRQHIVGALGALADVRRTMILAEPSFARYFRKFFSRGFARRRFGHASGKFARPSSVPMNPDDQIELLRNSFFDDVGAHFVETEKAVPAQRRPGGNPPTEQMGHFAHTWGASMQPPSPRLASSPGASQGIYFVSQAYAPPSWEAAAISGQESSGISSKQPSPGGQMGVWPYPPSSSTTRMEQPPESISDSPLEAKRWASTDDASPSEPHMALSGLWTEFEGGGSEGPQGPADDIAEALGPLSVLDEEDLIAQGGDGGKDVSQPLDGSPVHASQNTHAAAPTQGNTLFASSPWAAPGTPMGPHPPGVGPYSPRGGAFFGFPEGAPGLPTPQQPLPPGFLGPTSFVGLGAHIVHRHPAPLGEAHGVPGPAFSKLSPPPGFTEAFRSAEQMRHVLNTLPESPDSHLRQEDPHIFKPLHETVQHPFARGPSPSSPSSTPFLSGPLPPSPSHPTIEGPTHVPPPQPSMGSPPDVSTSVPGFQGSVPRSPGTPAIWTPLPTSPSTLYSSGPLHPRPLQPSFIGPSASRLPAPDVFGPPSTQSLPDKDESKSRGSGTYHGIAAGDSAPSVTSSAPHPPT